jgi:hypothetical protein
MEKPSMHISPNVVIQPSTLCPEAAVDFGLILSVSCHLDFRIAGHYAAH